MKEFFRRSFSKGTPPQWHKLHQELELRGAPQLLNNIQKDLLTHHDSSAFIVTEPGTDPKNPYYNLELRWQKTPIDEDGLINDYRSLVVHSKPTTKGVRVEVQISHVAGMFVDLTNHVELFMPENKKPFKPVTEMSLEEQIDFAKDQAKLTRRIVEQIPLDDTQKPRRSGWLRHQGGEK